MNWFTFLLVQLLQVFSKDIPTVDLSEPDEISASVLFEAATEYGFFYLVNHGISDQTRQSILEINRKFFNLNEEIKSNLRQNGTHWGYIPFGGEGTDPSKQIKKTLDTKEAMVFQNNIQYIDNTIINHNNEYNSNNNNNNHNNTFSMEFNYDIYKNHDLFKQNRWALDELVPNFKDTVENYMNEMYLLSNKITKIIALSLNLSQNYFLQPGIHDKPMDLLYLIHYPKYASDIEKGIYGTGEHSDYSLFTILLTDGNPGLQLLHRPSNGEWINIHDRNNNAFIINIADTLEQWTNNLYKSGKHRVLLNGDIHRYSIPYFVAANYNLEIDCLPNTYDNVNNKCNHEPFKSGEYLKYKLKQTILNFKSNKNSDNTNSNNQNQNGINKVFHNEL